MSALTVQDHADLIDMAADLLDAGTAELAMAQALGNLDRQEAALTAIEVAAETIGRNASAAKLLVQELSCRRWDQVHGFAPNVVRLRGARG